MIAMDFSAWLSTQINAPGALASLVGLLAIILVMLCMLVLWRGDGRRRRRARFREVVALAEIADHACDLVVEVADALKDEVNAADFVERFDRRALIDADLMLDAVPTQALPSLTLLRPLFELRWTVERSLEIADWLAEIIGEAEREGWRATAKETAGLAQRAALAADAFRALARHPPVID
jgi:hypothetical protein